MHGYQALADFGNFDALPTNLILIKINIYIFFKMSNKIKFGKVMIQLDATHMKFIQRSLSQHVSGIKLPIFRRTM
jgi:hypothetical protein